MTITVIGLDIAKNVFQVHGVDETGQVVLRRRLRRCDVLRLFGELSPALVGIEACHTGHFWARQIKALGHDVRLMPPQFVKPYVKTQKNDAADAEAICEAVTRPSMRFVPIKTAEQQSVLLLHRARDLLIRQRSSLVSAIKAHCAEFGIILAGGARDIDRFVEQLNNVCRELPDAARDMLALLGMQVRDVAARANEVEKKLLVWHRTNEASRRLATIPGRWADYGQCHCSDGSRCGAVQDRSPVCSMAWARPAAAFERRQGTPGLNLEARRRLHSSPADSRCASDCRLAQEIRVEGGSMDFWAVEPPASECCHGGARQ